VTYKDDINKYIELTRNTRVARLKIKFDLHVHRISFFFYYTFILLKCTKTTFSLKCLKI